MNNVRRGSISIPVVAPVAPVRENKDEKKEGIKTINLKIEEIAKHVEALELRKECSCDKVESRLLKELSVLSDSLKDLIEN